MGYKGSDDNDSLTIYEPYPGPEFHKEAIEWHKRMQASEDAHMRCTHDAEYPYEEENGKKKCKCRSK